MNVMFKKLQSENLKSHDQGNHKLKYWLCWLQHHNAEMALTNSPDIASRRESRLQQSVEEGFVPRATMRSPFLIEQELQFLRAEASCAELVEK
jgi:hypothetical protein